MRHDSPFALTPWVRRLLAATAAVYLLQVTIFTSGWLTARFGFVPDQALRQPWGLVTYAFLHRDFLHILVNMLLLFMFGPMVEDRLGSTRFMRLYLIAALGGPALSLLLRPLAGDAPIIGASAAVFGVMLAFVLAWPNAPVLIFPLPFPVRAVWLVVFLAGIDLVLGLMRADTGTAHFAHLGGFGAAFLYLRGPGLLHRGQTAGATERVPAVLVRPPGSDASRRADAVGPAPRRGPDPAALAEIDRVLDKISARGLASLTPEERRLLDEASKRFRQDS
jgi:membrane associated rhomboid family serine protease